MAPVGPLMSRILGVGDVGLEEMIRDRFAEALIEPTRFPSVNENAEGKENRQRNPAARPPLARDRNAGTAEEIERRLATEHGEDHVVRQLFYGVRCGTSSPDRRPICRDSLQKYAV